MVAPETAAHAAGTSALLPMLALGIPGSPTAAVLLGGLLIWGLQPGPLLFVEQKDFVWGLIASMYLGNIAGLIVVLTTVPLFASILRIPFSIIAPVIIVICAIGAYTVHNAMLDVWFMLGFGVVGYLFKKLDYPLAPLVLALVLGDKAEDSFRQAMLVSQGDVTIMWSNPLVGSITTLALLLLFWPLISKLIGADQAAQEVDTVAAPSSRSTEAGGPHDRHRADPGDGFARQGRRRQLAQDLGLAVMRHEVVDNVASRMHVPTSLINRLREGKAGAIERLRTDRASVAVYTTEEVLEVAARGNVVLRGWGATCLLRPVPHVVCVRVTRPFEQRVAWLMEQLGTDDGGFAEDEIRRSDRAHAARMHAQFGVTWGDPLLYDLVLNTDRVSVESCAAQIAALARPPRVRRDRGFARDARRHGARARACAPRCAPTRRRPDVDVTVASTRATSSCSGIVLDAARAAGGRARRALGRRASTGVDNQLRVMARSRLFPGGLSSRAGQILPRCFSRLSVSAERLR